MNTDSILARYADEMTSNTYITDPAIAREEEIKNLILVLLTPEKSAILVGKPGIGKTAIVEGLAYRIQRRLVPNVLLGYKIFRVNTTALLGHDNEGDNRVLRLVQELSHMDKVIWLDLANMFKEGLSRGTIKIIGATTTYEYETYVLRDKAFTRRFDKVDIAEPTQEQCVKILLQTLPKIEYQTNVKLAYTDFQKEEIMKFIVNMTSEYKRVYEIASRYPDIALVLLRQAFSNAVYENRQTVCFKNIYDAIRFTKAVYPDVIKKELVSFKEIFKDELTEEGVVVDVNNYLS